MKACGQHLTCAAESSQKTRTWIVIDKSLMIKVLEFCFPFKFSEKVVSFLATSIHLDDARNQITLFIQRLKVVMYWEMFFLLEDYGPAGVDEEESDPSQTS